MTKFLVELGDGGKRLDQFLQGKLGELSRSQIQKMIKAGEITVDGKEVAVHYFLKPGNEIKVKSQSASRRTKVNPPAGGQKSKLAGIKVIKEDKDYIVVNKPAGMVVHPDTIYKDNALVDWLVKKYPEVKKVGDDQKRPGIVHRLDKDVSGLMVVARTQKMFDYLKKQFQDRKVEKEYLALVHGVVVKDEGLIDRPIGRTVGGVMGVGSKNKKSREAGTQYRVVERFKNFTLLKIKIFTGRTHQIRAHMKSIGHGLIGDNLYVTRDIKRKKKQEDLGRVWLYACRLGFKDLDEKWQEFEVAMPEELKLFLGKIK
ncbi:RluA family pseudouridine synthase [Candidatus Kuenenbacteria bacterium]|nr:RluA family pseudouridine synthase [Candidatus Kuenenbacteria bacterium]